MAFGSAPGHTEAVASAPKDKGCDRKMLTADGPRNAMVGMAADDLVMMTLCMADET